MNGLPTPELEAKILGIRHRQRGRDARPSQVNSAKNQPSQLPLELPYWPDNMRAIPNAILRSALFGITAGRHREFMQRKSVSFFDGLTVLQTGPELAQSDRDVWEQCMYLARISGLGTRIEFSASSFLRAIGRTTGGKDVQWLKAAFARLTSSVVEIREGERAYFGPLILHGVRDDETGLYMVEINPNIAKLYGKDGWSQIEAEQCKALRRQPLAQWLYGFYSTHAAPFPMKVQTLHRLCNSKSLKLKHFRAQLREALEQIRVVAGWTWIIDDADLVKVSKKPTASQARHLIRKRAGTG